MAGFAMSMNLKNYESHKWGYLGYESMNFGMFKVENFKVLTRKHEFSTQKNWKLIGEFIKQVEFKYFDADFIKWSWKTA